MKKLIAIVLVAVMLLSVLPLATFAGEYYAGAAGTAPTVDGQVNEGEYSFASEKLVDGAANSGWVAFGAANFGEKQTNQFFYDYDDEYIYAAYIGVDETYASLTFDFAANPSTREVLTVRLAFQSVWTATNDWSWDGELRKGFVAKVTGNEQRTDLNWDDVVEAVGANTDNGTSRVIHVELKVKRSAISEDPIETLGVRAFTCPQDDGSKGEAYWGADPATSTIPYKCTGQWWLEQAGMHSLALSAQPAAPVTSNVVVDGKVNADEYYYATTQLVGGAAADGWGSITHNVESGYYFRDNQKVQLFFDFDDEYIYVAYVGEGETLSALTFDFAATPTTQEVVTIKLMYQNTWTPTDTWATGTLTKQVAAKITADFTTADLAADDYECVASNTDNGTVNINHVELKVKRSAIGADLETIGLRAFTCPQDNGQYGEAYWGDAAGTIPFKYADKHWLGRAGLNSFELVKTAPDTEAPDTEAPDTEAPDTEAPDTEAPEFVADIDLSTNVANAPKLDGTVSAGEYTFEYGAELPEGAPNWAAFDANGFLYSVDDAYTNGFRNIKWNLAADNDYVYIALSTKKVAGLEPDAYFMFFRSSDGIGIGGGSGNTAYKYTNVIKADGSISKNPDAIFALTSDDVVVKNVGDDYVFEARIKRSELGADVLYFMGRVYANDAPWGTFMTYGKGLIPLSISLSKYVAPHTCDYDWDTTSMDPVAHTGKCKVCGESVKAPHNYGESRVVAPATCMQIGRALKTCAVCQFSVYEPVAIDANAHNFVNGKCACGAVETVETDPAETKPAETTPVETKPAETKPAETKPAETKPAETTPVETEPAGVAGCAGSITAVAVALVAALGTCVVFAGKKRD